MKILSPKKMMWSGLCATMVLACGDEEATPNLQESRFDLVAALPDATVTSEELVIDIGTPEGRKHLGAGWARDAAGGPGGDYSWAVGESSVLRVPLTRPAHVGVTLRCRPFVAEGLDPQTVTVVVNGKEIGTVELKAGWSEYRLVATKGVFKQGTNRVEFRYAWSKSPRALGTSADRRDLAVAFDKVAFVPDAPADGLPDDTPRKVTVDFGNEASRAQLGEGWGGMESGPTGATYAWATAQAAEVSMDLGRPTKGRLLARARPFAYPKSPDQELTLSLNGRSLGAITLSGGWSEHVIEVEPESLVVGENDLDLAFEWARSPEEVGTGSDPRILAAAFDYITFEPEVDPAQGSTGALTLPLGRRVSYGLTLPPGTSLEVDMPDQAGHLVVEVEVLKTRVVTSQVLKGSGTLELSGNVGRTKGVRLSLLGRRGAKVIPVTIDRAALVASGAGPIDFGAVGLGDPAMTKDEADTP